MKLTRNYLKLLIEETLLELQDLELGAKARDLARNYVAKIARSFGITNIVKKGLTYTLKGKWEDTNWEGSLRPTNDKDISKGWMRIEAFPVNYSFGDRKKLEEWQKSFYKSLAQSLKSSGINNSGMGLVDEFGKERNFYFQIPSMAQDKSVGAPKEEPPFDISKYESKIKNEISSKGWYQIRFSNGEFITSSFAFAKDFSTLRDTNMMRRMGIDMYDSPDQGWGGKSNKVHWSEKLQLFWLNTGFFD